jgi:hypothetical protein
LITGCLCVPEVGILCPKLTKSDPHLYHDAIPEPEKDGEMEIGLTENLSSWTAKNRGRSRIGLFHPPGAPAHLPYLLLPKVSGGKAAIVFFEYAALEY